MPSALPIIDIEPLIAKSSVQKGVAHQINTACIKNGFFYITGHGISETLQVQLDQMSHDFFDLEQETKLRVRMDVAGRAWRGYFRVGDELTSGKPDLKEGIYFGQELSESDRRVRNGVPLHGANLFPEELPEFRQIVLDYITALIELGHHLMRGISLSLGLSASYFNRHYTKDPLILFRIFHYPAMELKESEQWGVGEHTDYGVLTILKQDSVGGLQVKSKSGWIDAPYIPGTFICNIGDMLDRLTRGYYRSTPHRVMNRSNVGRLSFPFFFDPNFNSKLNPIDLGHMHSAKQDNDARWDKTNVYDFNGTYGEYIMRKVSKVFPDLGKQEL